MSSEENFIKLDGIPTEVWVTLGVLGGVLLSYCLCMRQGYQDNWIGNVPPGPPHLPFIGCLLQLLKGSSLSTLMSRLFLLHGSHVKFCVGKSRAAVTCSEECLHHQGLTSISGEVLVYILRSLGLSLVVTRAFFEECSRLMNVMYNYQLPLEAVREMMEDLEKSGLTRKKKKLEYLVFQLTKEKEKVVLDKEEVEALEECSQKLEIFSSSLEETPTMFLPVFNYLPWYILQRKRIYKNISEVQQKLSEILNGKVKNVPTDGDDEHMQQLFFIIFIFINISRTVFRKQKAKRGAGRKSLPGQQVSWTDDVVTPLTNREFPQLSSPSERSLFLQRRRGEGSSPGQEEVLVDSQEKAGPSYDICGLRFYLATKSTKISSFNFPAGCLLVHYSSQ